MALTIVSEPTSIKRGTSINFEVSGALTTPTVANTSIAHGGDSLVTTNVHDLGAGSYLIVARCPSTITKLHDATGYAWTITINTESTDTSTLPFLPEPGWNFVTLSSPTTTSSLLTGYTATTAATNDQLMFTKGNYPEGLTLSVNADSTFSLNGTPAIDSIISRYVINSAGTVYAKEEHTTLPAMSYVMDDIHSFNAGSQDITGTCSRLHSQCHFSDPSSNRYNFVNVNANWSIPTDPTEITPYIAVASNQAVGTAGCYMYDHNLLRLANGNIMMIYRTGSSHADNAGYLRRIISTDEGVSWGSAVDVANDASFDTRNSAGGVDSTTGRIIVFYRVYSALGGGTIDVEYVTSTDNGATWSSGTSLLTTLNPYIRNSAMVAWGDMWETTDGLFQMFYSHDVALTLKSTDNGQTWGSPNVIYSGTEDTTFYGEPSVIKIDNSRAVMYVRKNGDGTLGTYDTICWCVSDDGGATFTHPIENEVDWTTTPVISPSTTRGISSNGNVVIGWGARKDISQIITATASNEYAYYAGDQLLQEDFPTRRVMFESTTNDTGDAIDFGMPHFLPLTGIDYTYLAVWYNSPDVVTNNAMADIWVGTTQRL